MKFEKNKKYVVHLPKKENEKELYKYVKWYDGDEHEYWDDYKEDYAVNIKDGVISGYCEINYFKNSTDYKDSIFLEFKNLKNMKKMKPKKINFLLKYDLDKDPIEEFETMKEVDDRIKELIEEEDDLKKDSIVIYEIKAKHTVSIETKISKKLVK